MSLPHLTEEQRRESLKKAAAARAKRAEFKQEIADRTLTARDALDQACDDTTLAKFRVQQFLRSLPGIGGVKADQIMEQLKIAQNRRLSGLGKTQRAALEDICDGIDKR